MPHTTQTSDFWGWYLRHNSRTVWKNFYDAGIDQFAIGPANNPQAFLELKNVVPSMNGGFNRRWGLQTYYLSGAHSFSVDPSKLVRTFFYNFPQDASDPSNTANTNLWIMTDDQNFFTFKDDGSLFLGTFPSNFANAGDVFACTSRGYFYYSNGVNPPKKVNPSYTASSTDSLMGIALPTVNTGLYNNRPGVLDAGAPGDLAVTNSTSRSGWGYSSPPTVTVTDTNGGTGTGCTITVSLDANGSIQTATITNPGSGYTQAQATLSGGGSPTRQGSLVLYTQTNASAPNAGKVVGFDLGGQINQVAGRQYAVALRNSKTGHTSDAYIQGTVPTYNPSGSKANFDKLTSGYNNIVGVDTNFPVFAASTNATAGCTQICTTIIVGDTVDPQVDTVLLLAGADGQGLSTLYEVAQIPLSSFTHITSGLYPGSYQYQYIDTLPDALNDQNISGKTLLSQNVWAETNSDGTTSGIFLNTPPPSSIKYLTAHQGRMFGTDGKTIFYSKSLDEVTTSSSLITSKWEECWPGDYQLPVALSNEQINSLKSDGTNLHAGTEKSIFTVYGSDPTNFSVPTTAFAETGIYSNDCWTVIYQEGQPSGFVWLTKDLKVMHSDFSTYREIGTPIYPVLQGLVTNYHKLNKIWSMTQGPYNFVILALYTDNNSGFPYPDFWIYETRLGKWYHWVLNSPPNAGGCVCPFVYQFPAYTSVTAEVGNKYLFFPFFTGGTGSQVYSFNRFNQAQANDYNTTNIPWVVDTSWQDLGDPTSVKCANEIDVVGDDGPFTVTLKMASSQAEFDSPNTISGTTVTGPVSRLQSNKYFVAGANTTGRYYSIRITPSSPGTLVPVLTSFSLETYPMARI